MSQFRSVILYALFGFAAVSAQSPSEFVGRWFDDSIAVTLEADDAGFRVAIEIDGESLPGSATLDGSRLNGSFESDGEQFRFQAQLAAGLLRFESDGEAFELQRATSQPSRNPLTRKRLAEAASDAALGPRVGDFRFAPPDGWTAVAAEGGSVALTPPDIEAPDSETKVDETYALSFLPGVEDPEDPRATAAVHQMLGPRAPIARLESEVTEKDGQRVVRRSFVVDASQYRLDGYFRAAEGGLVVVLGRGQSDRVEARAGVLESLVSRVTHVGQLAVQSGSDPAPANGIKVAANAPPFEPGEISDGQPQSQQWVAHLGGKVVTSSVSGTVRSTTLLRPDGHVEIASGRPVAAGWWRIVTVNDVSYLGLVIHPMVEEVYTRLEMRGGQIFADGVGVAVSAPSPGRI